MPRPKPQFNRTPADRNAILAPSAPDFSPAVLRRLAALCPPATSESGASIRSEGESASAQVAEGAGASPIPLPGPLANATLAQFSSPTQAAALVLNAKAASFAARAQNFAEAVLAEARWAERELASHHQALTRAQLLAELNYFEDRLRELVRRLQAMSPEVANMLPFDPLDTADSLRPVADAFAAAAREASRRPAKPRAAEAQRIVALELTVRVLRVARGYGMVIATGNSADATPTHAIKLMAAVGGAVKILRSASTWRELVSEARRTAPDLQ